MQACIALVKDVIDDKIGSEWHWRAEVFDGNSWNHTWSIGEDVGIKYKSPRTDLFMPDVTVLAPRFEIAIVPFSRAWSEIVNRTWRTSLWREYARLAQGLDAYDEMWLDKLNAGKFDGRMPQHIIGPDDDWTERDMQRWLAAMKQEWIKTPEGFFESKSKKNQHA